MRFSRELYFRDNYRQTGPCQHKILNWFSLQIEYIEFNSPPKSKHSAIIIGDLFSIYKCRQRQHPAGIWRGCSSTQNLRTADCQLVEEWCIATQQFPHVPLPPRCRRSRHPRNEIVKLFAITFHCRHYN